LFHARLEKGDAVKTIRWGIIGCGNVTEVKSGPGFQKASHSQLVAVMRRNGALAQDYAARHGVPKWYDDASALINDPDVDAVYIATPPSSHKEYALAVARAGKPVYVEKPMALNYAECVEMIRVCQSAGTPLFVAYYRRALPRFLKVKELIESGAIGEPRCVIVTLYQQPTPDELDPNRLPWRVAPEISGGGKFLDLASHTLDLLAFYLGPIQSAQGLASNQGKLYRAEDVVTGTFVFESGAHGAGTWCFTAFENRDMNEIIGTRGRLAFSTFGAEPVVLTTGESVTEFPIIHPPHIQQPLIQTIVDELNGRGHCPSTGETAARTSWVMDEMLKQYRRAA
jgi:predicted dehydrogenase